MSFSYSVYLERGSQGNWGTEWEAKVIFATLSPKDLHGLCYFCGQVFTAPAQLYLPFIRNKEVEKK